MKTFELVYTIEEANNWRSKESIKIKSNLSDDKLIDCEIAQSLVEHLRTESAILDPDKFLLNVAEAQKRGIQTIIEELDDISLQAKVNADKAHDILLTIADETDNKYAEIEKRFSDIQKRFTDKMKVTAESIKKDLEKLSAVEEKLTKIDNWKLETLNENLTNLIKLVEKDKDLVKLVLDFKTKGV